MPYSTSNQEKNVISTPETGVLHGSMFLLNDTQIRVISSMEPEIYTKMLRNLSGNFRAKYPATTLNHPLVKIAHLEDAFSDISEPRLSPVVRQSLLQKGRKRRKREAKTKIKKNEKP